MTRRAAIATLITGAALLLGTAGPASAADAPVVTISEPGGGEVLSGRDVTVRGEARMGDLNRITGITVTVTSSVGGGPYQCSDCWSGGQPVAGFDRTFRLDRNGPYSITVRATGVEFVELNGEESGETTRSFKVEVAPAAPRDVKVDVGADRRVTISWVRNTEPDLKGYQVTRLAPGSSSATVVDSVAQPSSGSRVSAVDTAVPPAGGTYRYVVTAVRPDRDGEVSDRAIARSSPVGAEVGAAPVDPNAPPGTGGAGPGTGPGPGPGAAPASTAPGGPKSALDVSSFLSRTGGAPPSLAVPGGVVLPVDNGFSDLPFAVPGGDIEDMEEPGSDDPAVLGTTESASNQRALLVPIAAGLLLCVLAFHLRQFNRTVLASPPAYHPIVDDDEEDAAPDEDDDDPPRSRTVVTVGAGRSAAEG